MPKYNSISLRRIIAKWLIVISLIVFSALILSYTQKYIEQYSIEIKKLGLPITMVIFTSYVTANVIFYDRPKHSVKIVIISYLTIIVAYGFIYNNIQIICSNYNRSYCGDKPFSTPLKEGEAWYFSVVTMATVGFGDIYPVAGIARIATSSQIIIGLFYSIAIFSIVSTQIAERSQSYYLWQKEESKRIREISEKIKSEIAKQKNKLDDNGDFE